MSSVFDFFLSHWPEIFLFDFLRYVIPASLLTAILALFARQLAHRRIQQRRRRVDDLSRELGYSMSTILIFSLVGLVIGVGEHLGWMAIQSGPFTWLQVLNLVVMVVLHDAYFYWTHRAMHHRKVFARVHRTHHLSRTPAPWTAYSFAPLEAVVEAAFLPIYLVLVPTHVVVIAVFLIHMIVRNVMAHAGVEIFPSHWMSWPILRHITVTSHHDAHHQESNCNYGLYFTWWDRWMGTEHVDYRLRFERLTNAQASGHPGKQACKLTRLSVIACAIGLTTICATRAEAQDQCRLDGYWVTEGFGAIVSIESKASPSVIRGTIRWVYDSHEQSLVGLDLFTEFSGQECTWQEGLILNPENNRRYRSALELDASGVLRVKGCIGPFCRTQYWRRYDQVLASLPPN